MKRAVFTALCLLGFAGLFGILSSGRETDALPAGTTADKIVVEKSRHMMTLYKDGESLRAYQISLGRGGLDPKGREGDNLTPEGLYRINGRNERSAFHLALRISYPETRDVEAAREKGQSPGSDIMIHGIRNGLGWLDTLHRQLDWTAGCVAVTNREIEEIWRVVPDGTPIEIKP